MRYMLLFLLSFLLACSSAPAPLLEQVLVETPVQEQTTVQEATVQEPVQREPAKQETPQSTGPVSEAQARQIAQEAVPSGRITDVELERKFGKRTIVVELRDGRDEVDVVIEIATGEILDIERD